MDLSGDDDHEAVREAIEDLEGGDRGVTLDDFDTQFRQEHGLPPRL